MVQLSFTPALFLYAASFYTLAAWEYAFTTMQYSPSLSSRQCHGCCTVDRSLPRLQRLGCCLIGCWRVLSVWRNGWLVGSSSLSAFLLNVFFVCRLWLVALILCDKNHFAFAIVINQRLSLPLAICHTSCM